MKEEILEGCKNKKIQSFLAAFLLHALLLIFLFYDFQQDEKLTVVEVSTISIINESKSAKSSKKTNVSPKLKSEQNKISESSHNSDSNNHAESGEVANLVFNPLPKIPDELRYEAFQSEALARFYIAPSGEVINVELVKPCANPKLNYLLLKSLRQWKFSSQNVDSRQEIKIKFKVE